MTTTVLPPATPFVLFKQACTSQRHRVQGGAMLQSIPIVDQIGKNVDNALVHGVVWAYDKQHHLLIRPDDVWTCILLQFSTYIRKHWDMQPKIL